jgi:hypothetical protein
VNLHVQRSSAFSAPMIVPAGLFDGGGWSEGDLVSGGVGGDIHVSDTRMLGQPSFLPTYSATSSTSSQIRSLVAFDRPLTPLDAFAVHEHAPLFAAGSRKQVVRIADFKTPPKDAAIVGSNAGSSGNLAAAAMSSSPSSMGLPGPTYPMLTPALCSTISTLKFNRGFMGQRIGPVTALGWHPNKLVLGVGALNPLVTIMAAFPPAAQ